MSVGELLTAQVSGIQRCGSPWACPMCAPVVRARRAGEIDIGLGGHLAREGGGAFVSMTLRHTVADALKPRLDVVSEAQHSCLTGKRWNRLRRELGVIGSIRAVEITDGRNGWHPHVHIVFVTRSPLTDVQVEELRRFLLDRWSLIVQRKGFGTLNGTHGVDVRPLTREGVGEYLGKVDTWSVGAELTSMTKGSRSSSGRTPYGLLLEAVETGESRLIARWCEYERATFGKRAIVWSPGLRDALGVEDERSDEELAAAEGLDVELLRYLVQAAHWRADVRAGRHGELLDEIEADAARRLAVGERGEVRW